MKAPTTGYYKLLGVVSGQFKSNQEQQCST